MNMSGRRVMRIVIGLVTMMIIMVLFAVLSIVPGPASWVDSPATATDALDQEISPTQLETYCPAPMDLADTGAYGDSEYQASTGNLDTKARYASFGSIYSSDVSTMGSDGEEDGLTLRGAEAGDAAGVWVGSQDIDHGSRLIETHMLQAGAGTGATGSIASWADQGDLKGVSAASCISTSLRQRFLLSSTATGNTQQLIVANPSSKSTTVDVQVWGSKQTGNITMSTQSKLAVPAGGETALDLSAAAPDQEGLYVTVSSKQTPVAAVVRSVSMQGLTSRGSDFALPLSAPSNASSISAVAKGDEVTAYLFSGEDTTANLSWITEGGLVSIKGVNVDAHKVCVVDIGRAPDDALGLMSISEDALSISAKVTRSGEDGQRDFALINAGVHAEYSAVSIPDGVDATMSLTNAANNKHDITVSAYGADGTMLAKHAIVMEPNAATTLSTKDLADSGNIAAIMVQDGSAQISWAVRVSREHLGDGKITGLSVIPGESLMPVTSRVWTRENPAIVR